MSRINATLLAAIGTAAMVQGCSTMERINAQDWTPYSGTKAASQPSNANAVDAVSSAVADTVLLPITATSWAFGYRYDPSTHSMRQSANNWGWPSYPPSGPTTGVSSTRSTAIAGSAGASGSSVGASTPGSSADAMGASGATGSTGTSTSTGTSGGTPMMGTTMSSGLSPESGNHPSSTSTPDPGATRTPGDITAAQPTRAPATGSGRP